MMNYELIEVCVCAVSGATSLIGTHYIITVFLVDGAERNCLIMIILIGRKGILTTERNRYYILVNGK